MDTGKGGTPDRPEHHRLYRIRTDAEQIPNYIYFSCQNRRAQANLSRTSAFGHPKRKRFRDVCPIYDCIYLFHSSSSVSPQAVLLRECSGLGNPHKNVSPHRSRVRSTHCTCHSGLVFPAAVRGFQLLFFIIPFLYCVRSVSPAFRPSFLPGYRKPPCQNLLARRSGLFFGWGYIQFVIKPFQHHGRNLIGCNFTAYPVLNDDTERNREVLVIHKACQQ